MYSLKPPLWGGSNMYPQSIFWAKIRKNFKWNLSFLYNCILHRRVIMMRMHLLSIQNNLMIPLARLIFSTKHSPELYIGLQFAICNWHVNSFSCNTVKPVLSDHPFRWHGHRYWQVVAFCWMKAVQKAHAALLSCSNMQPPGWKAKNMSCLIWSLNTGLTTCICNTNLHPP